MKFIFALFASIILISCSIQQTYYDSDLSVATEQARSGNIKAAEQSYVSAVTRAKQHLTAREVSIALYNMGTFYRQQSNYDAAIKALKHSITYAGKADSFSDQEMGRRYIALAASYAELGQFKNGSPYLKKLAPFWSQYSSDELSFIKAVFTLYRSNLAAAGEDITFIPESALIKIDRYSKPPG